METMLFCTFCNKKLGGNLFNTQNALCCSMLYACLSSDNAWAWASALLLHTHAQTMLQLFCHICMLHNVTLYPLSHCLQGYSKYRQQTLHNVVSVVYIRYTLANSLRGGMKESVWQFVGLLVCPSVCGQNLVAHATSTFLQWLLAYLALYYIHLLWSVGVHDVIFCELSQHKMSCCPRL